MIIHAISDLHGYRPALTGGDLLIIAGDLTARDEYVEYGVFFEWLESLDYKRKIIIAGNHDNKLNDDIDLDFPDLGIEYLQDSGTEFEGLKIWGTPHSLWFNGINPNCKAFTGRERQMRKWYEKIPEGLDILISHGPPYGILDKNYEGKNCGCISLMNCIEMIMPEMVLFGHIHENGGQYVQKKGILYINGSVVDERYRLTNNGRKISFDASMPKMQRFKVVK